MTTCPRSFERRGALLLLVLGMLTLFVIVGGLLLTLAGRTRTAARAVRLWVLLTSPPPE